MALVLCSACRRHVRARERVCPFCSAVRVLVVGAALVACHASHSSVDPASASDDAGASLQRVPAAVYGGPPPMPPPIATVPAPTQDAAPIDVDGGALTPHADSMAKVRTQYKRCFEQGIRRDPNMAGRLVVSIDVGADGKAIRASIAKNTGVSADVADCVAAASGALEFAPPAGGSATVEMPVNFAKQ